MIIPGTTHALPLATLRRERMLPTAGYVIVDEGVRVEATTVIAKAIAPGKHFIYDLSRRFGVKPEEVDHYIKAKPNTEVEKGKVLALKAGMFGGNKVTAPARGKVVTVEGGRLLFESLGHVVEVRAGFGGQVISVTPELGITIEATASLVQGVWGSGKEEIGLLKMISDDRGGLIDVTLLDASCTDSILVGGLADDAVLRAAQKARVKGLVVGGIPSASIPVARSMSYPIVVTEGFGKRPMAEPLWTLLASQDGREVFLDARPADRWTGHRPEIIIPLPTPYTPPPQPAEGQKLSVGRKVRVLRVPYPGVVGVIRSIPDRPYTFLSGIQGMGAYLEADGATIFVPLENLEVLE
ncbi:MAG: hypothetical protein HZB17_07875 [Chloroflexi bacterium]|nr:hypothetical protein [Chloroflexota bacterium]